jgi:hypothetical protein
MAIATALAMAGIFRFIKVWWKDYPNQHFFLPSVVVTYRLSYFGKANLAYASSLVFVSV